MRIKVIGRIRPLLNREKQLGDEVVTHISSATDENPRSSSIKTDISIYSKSKMSLIPKSYRLDGILDENSRQEEVFLQIMPLLDDLIENGFNCTIFTYGQTGTGKTYTMLGYDLWSAVTQQSQSIPTLYPNKSSMGIIPRSMVYLFQQLAAKNGQYQVLISYLEIYNEKLIDLLNIPAEDVKQLSIQENKQGQIIIPGLVEVEVRNIDEVFEVLWTGAKARSIAATDMNDYSSRSHTIFQVQVSQTYLSSDSKGSSGGPTRIVKQGKLSFVDLAGSEKWKSHQLSKFTPERIRELTSINKSLSALGKCIAALLRFGTGASTTAHIPYRESKLTRILQDSLGGNSKTLFIVTLSPAISCVDETTSTLQFADRAMKVQIFATPNVSEESEGGSQSKSIERYKQEIANLKAIIQSLAKGQGSASTTDQEPLGDGYGYEIERSLANEVAELRAENHALARKLSIRLRELNSSTSALNRLTKAVFGPSFFTLQPAVPNQPAAADYPVTEHEEEGEKESELKSQSTMLMDKLTFDNSLDSQMRSLEVLYSELDTRGQHVADMQLVQEERWQSLMKFHSWLQSQAQIRRQKDGATASSGGRGRLTDVEEDEDDTAQRVALLETSVLFQSEELQRAKASFIKTNNQLSEELLAARQEICQLQNLLASKQYGSPCRDDAQTNLDDCPTSPCLDCRREVPAALKSHLKKLESISRGYSDDEVVVTETAAEERSESVKSPSKDSSLGSCLTPSKIPRLIRRRHSSAAARQSLENADHSLEPLKDMQGVQAKLSELVELLSTPKYEDIKQLLSQLNILSNVNKAGSTSLGDCESQPISKQEEERFEVADVATNTNLATESTAFPEVVFPDKWQEGTDREQDWRAAPRVIDRSCRSSLSSLTSIDVPSDVVSDSMMPTNFESYPHVNDGTDCERALLPVTQCLVAAVPPQDDSDAFQTVPVADIVSQDNVSSQDKRRRSSRKSVSKTSKPHKPSGKVSHKYLWRAYVDATSGQTYYHNKRDNITTWESPSEDELRLIVMADGSVCSDSQLL